MLARNRSGGLKGLRRARCINDLTSTQDIAESDSIVTPGRSWVSFRLDFESEPGNLYWVWLPDAKGMGWCYQKEAPVGTNRAILVAMNDHHGWRSKHGSYVFRLTPILKPYGASNVVNEVRTSTTSGSPIATSHFLNI